jgi:site-specific DNA recombinase
MQDSSPKRIALYARVSSEEQREGQTIDSQIAELERFAKERAWEIVETYKDDGWSGGVLARPELDRLRDDASKSRFDAVLVNDVDRVARDVAHLGVIKRGLERQGVELIFRKLPAESSPMRNLMVNILGSFAEFERELILDRTRRGKRHKAEVRKQFIGCIPPYGYIYIPKRPNGEEGALQVNPQEAAVVREMYRWVDEEGLSARKVMSRLNKTGLPPRKGAGRWAKSSVLRILRTSVYAGTWYYNKLESCEPAATRMPTQKYKRLPKSSSRLRAQAEWVPVPLPGELHLVPTDQWERVQNRLNQNIAFSPRNSKHNYFLRGLVRCAGCGARFVGDPCHHKFYYRCLQRCKKVGTVREEALDAAVWGSLREAILNPELIVESVSGLQERDIEQTRMASVQITDVEKSLDQIHKEESRALEAYRREIISAEQLHRELQLLVSRKASLEDLSRDLPKGSLPQSLPRATIRERVIEFCQQIAARLESMVPEEKQQVVRYIVNEVEFDGLTAQVRGIIPIGDSENGSVKSEAGQIGAMEASPRGRNPAGIVVTVPWSHGRNPGTVLTTGLRTGMPEMAIEFRLTRPINR